MLEIKVLAGAEAKMFLVDLEKAIARLEKAASVIGGEDKKAPAEELLSRYEEPAPVKRGRPKKYSPFEESSFGETAGLDEAGPIKTVISDSFDDSASGDEE